MDKQKKWAGWVIVALIVVVAAVAIAMTSQGDGGAPAATDPDLEAARPALTALFPDADADGFTRLHTQDGGPYAYAAAKQGDALGYAVWQTQQGYAGPVEVAVAIQPDGALRSIQVGGSDFQETENLGAKAKEPEFTDRFAGMRPPLTLNEDVDAISGATVTSQAVVDAVNAAPTYLAQLMQGGGTLDQAQPQASAAPDGRTANVSTLGYAGPVLVRLTLDENNAISALDVGGVRFSESEGVGSRVREHAFTDQFIGKTPPLTLGQDVDGVSGATVSSTAVVDAVNEAHAFLTNAE